MDVSLVCAHYPKQLRQARAEGRRTGVPYNPNLPVETWRDLGARDGTHIIFTQRDSRLVRVIDCFGETGQGLTYFAKEPQNQGYFYDRSRARHLPDDAPQTE